jgi:hypothetical protein
MAIFEKPHQADKTDPDTHAPPLEDEQGLVNTVDWSPEEEKKAKRK